MPQAVVVVKVCKCPIDAAVGREVQKLIWRGRIRTHLVPEIDPSEPNLHTRIYVPRQDSRGVDRRCLPEVSFYQFAAVRSSTSGAGDCLHSPGFWAATDNDRADSSTLCHNLDEERACRCAKSICQDDYVFRLPQIAVVASIVEVAGREANVECFIIKDRA